MAAYDSKSLEVLTRRQICETCDHSGNPNQVTMWCKLQYETPCMLNGALKNPKATCPIEATLPTLRRQLSDAVFAGKDEDAIRLNRRIAGAIEQAKEWNAAQLDPLRSPCQGKTGNTVEQDIAEMKAIYKKSDSYADGPRGIIGPIVVYVSTGTRPSTQPPRPL